MMKNISLLFGVAPVSAIRFHDDDNNNVTVTVINNHANNTNQNDPWGARHTISAWQELLDTAQVRHQAASAKGENKPLYKYLFPYTIPLREGVTMSETFLKSTFFKAPYGQSTHFQLQTLSSPQVFILERSNKIIMLKFIYR